MVVFCLKIIQGQGHRIYRSDVFEYRNNNKISWFVSTDVHLGCESSIPLVAQELMKKMVRQFALEYASKCLLNTSTNGVTTRTSSPLSETADAPLDLTVSRTQEKEDTQSEPGRKYMWYIVNL